MIFAIVIFMVSACIIAEIVNKYKRWRKSDAVRKKTKCEFNDSLSKKDFNTIVEYEVTRLKRLEGYEISGPIVRVYLLSQSGASSWQFEIDYNDFGRVSGQCWIYSENKESRIPGALAERISNDILLKQETGQLPGRRMTRTRKEREAIRYCPFCGERMLWRDGHYCSYCGSFLK